MDEKKLIELEQEYERLIRLATEKELLDIVALIMKEEEYHGREIAVKYSQLRFDSNFITLSTSGYSVRKNHKIRRIIISWDRGMSKNK